MLQRVVDRLRLLKHFFLSARRRGVMRTMHISLYELWFERKFGGATGIVIPLERLGYDEDDRLHAHPYFPSSYLFLHEALTAGSLNCRGRVFVDFGCGMGRVLLFASTLPFKRIIGVELSRSLCETATQNLQSYYRLRQKGTPEWTIAHADARFFRIPDDATVFYMFNPFDAVVVAKVLENIVASARAAPRTCYLIYANPRYEHLLSQCGFSKVELSTTDFVIYTYQ
jgi:predicted RNA methylase